MGVFRESCNRDLRPGISLMSDNVYYVNFYVIALVFCAAILWLDRFKAFQKLPGCRHHVHRFMGKLVKTFTYHFQFFI